jgi:hypothetical protein
VERAEAKVFANRERYKNYFITKPLRRAYGKLFTLSGNYQDTPRLCEYWVLASDCDTGHYFVILIGCYLKSSGIIGEDL